MVFISDISVYLSKCPRMIGYPYLLLANLGICVSEGYAKSQILNYNVSGMVVYSDKLLRGWGLSLQLKSLWITMTVSFLENNPLIYSSILFLSTGVLKA